MEMGELVSSHQQEVTDEQLVTTSLVKKGGKREIRKRKQRGEEWI